MKTDNELIAEFMGYEFGVVGYVGTDEETQWQKDNADLIDTLGIESIGEYWVNRTTVDWFEADDILFDRKWDWLMPVVEKIENTCHVQIIGKSCHITNVDVYFGGRSDSKIEAVYKAVVDFIKWYNSQKNL